MKKLFALILSICLIIPFMGCQNKKAELQKKYDDTTYQIQQTQQHIKDLQDKIDLDKAARDDADKSGATSDTEYGKVLANQDDETYDKSIGELAELQKELETEKLEQDSLKEQLDKMN